MFHGSWRPRASKAANRSALRPWYPTRVARSAREIIRRMSLDPSGNASRHIARMRRRARFLRTADPKRFRIDIRVRLSGPWRPRTCIHRPRWKRPSRKSRSISPRFRPRRLPIGLRGEALPSLPSTPINNLSTAGRPHAEPESVFVLPLPVAGLEGALHSRKPFGKGEPESRGRGGTGPVAHRKSSPGPAERFSRLSPAVSR